MCWIFAYAGNRKDADAVLLHGLERLEYRWYDSAWIAVWDAAHGVETFKSVGKVSALAKEIADKRDASSEFRFWIAHTRWATHGGVTIENTHPHSDSESRLFLVHNGIVENYGDLAEELTKAGAKFYGQTDSEIVAKLIGKETAARLRTGSPDALIQAVEAVLPRLEGAYALLVMHADFPWELIGVKYWSPLVFWRNPKTGECFFASDVQALAGYADQVTFLDDGDLVRIKGDLTYEIRSEWSLVSRPFERVETESLKADKGDFEHFMLKEIYEQPRVMKAVFQGRADFKDLVLNAAAFQDLRDADIERIKFIACWTSYHSGWAWTYAFREFASMSATAEIASEFLNCPVRVDHKTLYVFISQSGETADAIEPLKFIKAQGGKTFWVVNVVGSSISRLTDFWLFTRAWTEVGVASTKAFTAQLATVMLLALFYAIKRWEDFRKYRLALDELSRLPEVMEGVLGSTLKIERIAKDLSGFPHLFFLGRWHMLPIAAEAALKFKEITYLHAHAMPLGELKHWTLALIDETCPSVVFLPDDQLFSQNKSSVAEIRARWGKVLAISAKPIPEADWNIVIDNAPGVTFDFAATVVWQLLAYHAAKTLGREIDRPRNLAKSVTVK